MKTLIVVDSQYGNTRQIAEVMQSALPDSRLVMAKDFKSSDLDGVQLLLAGSPTQAGRPTQAVQAFIDQLPGLGGIKAAAFDTRIDVGKMNFFLRLLLKPIGFAAPKMAALLKKKGLAVSASEGFIVEDKEGPLRTGELDRAKSWAAAL